MALQNNPFYLLKVSCKAGRREIVAAADESSFILDSETSARTQNELINLNTRLSAEINWFVDADEDTVERIRSCIYNKDSIPTDGLSAISKLNATLYNFSISDEADPYEMGYSILDIDEQYSALDIEVLTSIINQKREGAKLGTTQAQDVREELGKKREEIRQIITEKLSALDLDSYIELVTILAGKYIANDEYKDGVILSDIIDQYEIRMQSALEESTDEIEKFIERIKTVTNDEAIARNIDSLILKVEKWDVLAQPLQLKSQASGMPHKISEHLGSELRDLALFLNNEKGLTKEALTLANAMKRVFAELGVLSDLFETDSGALNDLLEGQKDAEEIVAELKSLQNESANIKSLPSPLSVNNFVERVKKLDQRINDLDFDSGTKTKVRENLCYMARDTAIELHNTKHLTVYALTIAKALFDEFKDMPVLRLRLENDVITLNQQILLSGSNRAVPANPSSSSTSSSSDKNGCLLGILGVIVTIILLWVFTSNTFSSCQYRSGQNKASSSYSQSSGSSSSNSSSSYKVTLDKSSGTSGTSSVNVRKGSAMPVATAPTRSGYTFKGYYSSSNGGGTQYYDANMKSVHNWDKSSGGTLYAYWVKKSEGKFTSSSVSGDAVYADIVSIFPEIGIYSQGNTNYHHFVCSCKTSSGSTVWVYMTCNEYKNNFDSLASTSIYVDYQQEKTYSGNKRIHGTAKRAESIMSGLSSEIGSSMLIDFSSLG